MLHVATIKAYERKEELGGGFRGAFIPTKDGAKIGLIQDQSEITQNYSAAKYWAQQAAHEAMTLRGLPYRRSYVSRSFVGNKYVANIWVA